MTHETDWDRSAQAWIRDMGNEGDWGRKHVLDPAMLERLDNRHFARALDVGCGEGRFCRMMRHRRIAAVGIDPTQALLEAARARDPGGDYRAGIAEDLPFDDASFDLVVSYLSLIDIPDYRAAISEMARVLRPGGTLLIANLNGFVTSKADIGWIRDQAGNRLYYPVDNYSDEFSSRLSWRNITIENWHRPFSAYMQALLASGLELRYFDEPRPRSGENARQERYRRVPWFHLMEWRKIDR